MNNPFFTQEGSRARNDDGTEATATWRQNENVDDTQDLDTVYRIRFEVLNDSGFTSSNTQFALEAQKNGGTFFDVTDISSNVRIILSQLVDEADTTQIISAGTFVTPNGGQEETNGNAGRASYGANEVCEFEWSYEIRSAEAAASDTFDFRVKSLDAYDVAGIQITVASGVAPTRRIFVVT